VLNIQNISKDSKIIKRKLKETTFASKDRIYPEKVRHAARCTWDSLIILTIESLAPRDVVSFAVEGGYNWAVVEVDCVEFVYLRRNKKLTKWLIAVPNLLLSMASMLLGRPSHPLVDSQP
jgi:hypothetical protein